MDIGIDINIDCDLDYRTWLSVLMCQIRTENREISPLPCLLVTSGTLKWCISKKTNYCIVPTKLFVVFQGF
jgi:hypothetical protein